MTWLPVGRGDNAEEAATTAASTTTSDRVLFGSSYKAETANKGRGEEGGSGDLWQLAEESRAKD
jgi:hypothetical protein